MQNSARPEKYTPASVIRDNTPYFLYKPLKWPNGDLKSGEAEESVVGGGVVGFGSETCGAGEVGIGCFEEKGRWLSGANGIVVRVGLAHVRSARFVSGREMGFDFLLRCWRFGVLLARLVDLLRTAPSIVIQENWDHKQWPKGRF